MINALFESGSYDCKALNFTFPLLSINVRDGVGAIDDDLEYQDNLDSEPFNNFPDCERLKEDKSSEAQLEHSVRYNGNSTL